MAAIVRAAACSVASRTLKSSSFRGYDTLGIGSARGSGESTLWVEQTAFHEWVVGLGIATINGPVYDWRLVFTAQGEQVIAVTIGTSDVLTRDGVQVHKDEYLECRELVVAGLTAPSPPNVDPELAATTRGLSFLAHQFIDPLMTPYDGEFTLTTVLASGHARRVLATELHFVHSPDGPTDDRFLIGLGGASGSSWADLSIRNEGGVRAMRFVVHLTHDADSIVANVLATRHARRLAALALSLLRANDPSAAISEGSVLTDGVN
jgi:hypothetical protein